MKKFTAAHANPARAAAIVGTFAAGLCLVAACSDAGHTFKTQVIAIDRSHSTAATRSWPEEVAGIVQQLTLDGFKNEVGKIVLASIGTDTYEASKVAEVSLKLDCSNKNVCNDDKSNLAGQLGSAARQVAAATVKKSGTDIVAAIATAKAICGPAPCGITLVTDGGDSRLNTPGSPEQLVAKFAAEFPNLTGVTVQLIGLGADATGRTHVDRTKAFWTLALKRAGVPNPVVARSI
jgi:hypothetical protein